MKRRRHLLAPLIAALGLAACPSQTPEPRPGDVAAATLAPRPPASGDATLLLMADLHGVLKPCGCTVDLQKGGFDRLGPFLAKERARYPEARLLHAGPLFFEDAVATPETRAQRGRQAEVVAELVARVGVDVAGATAVDAAAAGGDLALLTERARLKLTAANLTLAAGPPVAAYDVSEMGGVRVGIFALASPTEAAHLGSAGQIEDPALAATRTVRALDARADVIVLLSALGLRETKRLVRKVPGIHFAVVGGMGEHPAYSDEAELVGDTRVMQFHREGRFVGRLTVHLVKGQTAFVDASAVSAAELAELDGRITALQAALGVWGAKAGSDDRPRRSAQHHLARLLDERDRLAARRTAEPSPDQSSFSFTQTPLSWDLPQDTGIVAIMAAFDQELAQIHVAQAASLPEPAPGEPYYVGAAACDACHEDARRFWEGDRHAQAWDTLVQDKKTFDAGCVSCHVTGYGRPGGSLVGRTAGREDVQCEACHGPGSQHVQDEEKSSILGHPTAETCTPCHSRHHSPNFDFEAYRRKLVVPGHGLPLLGGAE